MNMRHFVIFSFDNKRQFCWWIKPWSLRMWIFDFLKTLQVFLDNKTGLICKFGQYDMYTLKNLLFFLSLFLFTFGYQTINV